MNKRKYFIITAIIILFFIGIAILLSNISNNYGYLFFISKLYNIIVSNIGITAVIALASVAIAVVPDMDIERQKIKFWVWITSTVFFGVLLFLSILSYTGIGNFGDIVINGYVYHGATLGNMANGKGVLIDPVSEEIVYDGEFRSNMYHGTGKEYREFTIIEAGKETKEYRLYYDGPYKANKPDGKGKKYTVNNGIYYMEYDGYFEEGIFCGQGQWYCLCNNNNPFMKYDGAFEKGTYNGKGILYTRIDGESHILYDGYFVDGQYNGKGYEYSSYTLADGSHVDKINYDGEFKDGVYSGHGEQYILLADGTYFLRYNGAFEKGMYNGYGTQFMLSDRERIVEYTGFHVDNQRQGEGWLYEVEDGVHYLKYHGNFSNGMYNGEGCEYRKAEGLENKSILVYEGEFKDNRWHGKGTEYFIEEDGDEIAHSWKYYVGDFSDGLYSGHGTFYDRDGNITYDGELSHGERVNQ